MPRLHSKGSPLPCVRDDVTLLRTPAKAAQQPPAITHIPGSQQSKAIPASLWASNSCIHRLLLPVAGKLLESTVLQLRRQLLNHSEDSRTVKFQDTEIRSTA